MKQDRLERRAKGDNTTICLPTYDERENLELIVHAILKELPLAHILIVDDDSPDGTGIIADRLAAKDDRIGVLHRLKKEGLGRAYLAGFRQIIQKSKSQYLIQMDADFSHPVSVLPQLITQAGESADLVIGSRYVPGGGIENWNFHRRLLSRFGSFYARVLLGLSIRDLTSGLKLWKIGLLQQVLDYVINSSGYVFQVETTYIAHQLGAKIVEVPFVFPDRKIGKSKMSIAVAFEAGWRLLALAIQRYC